MNIFFFYFKYLYNSKVNISVICEVFELQSSCWTKAWINIEPGKLHIIKIALTYIITYMYNIKNKT
jgi:hypothetical protein